MNLEFSFIIPVFNRPEEIDELLSSLSNLNTSLNFEVVIIEDGSTLPSKHIVENYKNQLNISYFFKPNSGPGDSRNYGMEHAKGNYFIILDSDCIIPKQYLTVVENSLKNDYVDCFGGPDAAHESFTNLQKAINFSMTSFLTTGGIRGNKKSLDKFQPRSFNMGISKKAFQKTKGFGRIHPGEDPDLSIRLWKAGFKTKLIPEAYVFHKRRISWKTFYKQVNKFGLVRPILNKWHPETQKVTYWFPLVFSLSFIAAIMLSLFNIYLPLFFIVSYYMLAVCIALFETKNISVALASLIAITIQFFGYGYGFLKSTILVGLLNKNPEQVFPYLFFKLK